MLSERLKNDGKAQVTRYLQSVHDVVQRQDQIGQGPQPFINVEGVTTKKICAETTTYVCNISNKYNVAYKLVTDVSEVQRKAREGLQPGSN